MDTRFRSNLLWAARRMAGRAGWGLVEEPGFHATRAPVREAVFNHVWAGPSPMALARARAFLSNHQVRWFLAPDQDEAPLLAAGLRLAERTLEMVRPLDDLGPDPGGPEVGVTAPGSEAALEPWFRIAGEAFGTGAAAEAAVYLPLLRDAGHVAFLGTWHGQPAATALVSPGDGLAGVHAVATLPSFRRLGLGAALTHACLRQARAWGMRHAALYSSALGQTVYRRLGFEPVAEWREYLGGLV